jgi:hypothetical protein
VEVFLDEEVAITGMSLRLHFDSTLLTFEAIEDPLSSGYLGFDVRADTVADGGGDGDPATDTFIVVGWNDLDTAWPPGPGPSHFLFGARFLQPSAAATTLQFTSPSNPPGYPLDAPAFDVPFN